MTRWTMSCHACGNEATCNACVTELNRMATSRRIRDMKDIGLFQGPVLIDPNETQVLLTQQLWTDLDTQESGTTERLQQQA